jgi:hypothetical protein
VLRWPWNWRRCRPGHREEIYRGASAHAQSHAGLDELKRGLRSLLLSGSLFHVFLRSCCRAIIGMQAGLRIQKKVPAEAGTDFRALSPFGDRPEIFSDFWPAFSN